MFEILKQFSTEEKIFALLAINSVITMFIGILIIRMVTKMRRKVDEIVGKIREYLNFIEDEIENENENIKEIQNRNQYENKTEIKNRNQYENINRTPNEILARIEYENKKEAQNDIRITEKNNSFCSQDPNSALQNNNNDLSKENLINSVLDEVFS